MILKYDKYIQENSNISNDDIFILLRNNLIKYLNTFNHSQETYIFKIKRVMNEFKLNCSFQTLNKNNVIVREILLFNIILITQLNSTIDFDNNNSKEFTITYLKLDFPELYHIHNKKYSFNTDGMKRLIIDIKIFFDNLIQLDINNKIVIPILEFISQGKYPLINYDNYIKALKDLYNYKIFTNLSRLVKNSIYNELLKEEDIKYFEHITNANNFDLI